MSRAKKLYPATANEMSRRIKMILGLLPLSKEELRKQVCVHPEDAPLFEPALRALRTAGAVIRDKHRTWLRAAPRTIA